MKRLYVIQKYVWAASVSQALKQDKRAAPDSVYLDDKWRENNTERPNEL